MKMLCQNVLLYIVITLPTSLACLVCRAAHGGKVCCKSKKTAQPLRVEQLLSRVTSAALIHRRHRRHHDDGACRYLCMPAGRDRAGNPDKSADPHSGHCGTGVHGRCGAVPEERGSHDAGSADDDRTYGPERSSRSVQQSRVLQPRRH